MRQNFAIEVIMNPQFNSSILPGNDRIQAEQKWMSIIMLSFLNKQEAIFETTYLGSTGEMTNYCLS